jgi:hypothetical protein
VGMLDILPSSDVDADIDIFFSWFFKNYEMKQKKLRLTKKTCREEAQRGRRRFS